MTINFLKNVLPWIYHWRRLLAVRKILLSYHYLTFFDGVNFFGSDRGDGILFYGESLRESIFSEKDLVTSVHHEIQPNLRSFQGVPWTKLYYGKDTEIWWNVWYIGEKRRWIVGYVRYWPEKTSINNSLWCIPEALHVHLVYVVVNNRFWALWERMFQFLTLISYALSS